MSYVQIDLSTIPVASTELIQADFSADANAESQPIKRRILAVSEGTHNKIHFDGHEIEKMVKGCVDLKAKSGKQYISSPITIGHTDNPMMKVGTTFDLKYDPELKAAIADIELWQDTSLQKDLIKLIKRDPDNTFFSVRVIGKMEDGDIKDLKLIHIANVLQPADSNARMLMELSDDVSTEDLSKKQDVYNEPNQNGSADDEEDYDDEEEEDDSPADDVDPEEEDSEEGDEEETDSEDDDEDDNTDEEEEEFDHSLYNYPVKQSSMSEDVAQKLIELQRINDRLVADLEEAHGALTDAEREIEDLSYKLEHAEEKGKLIAAVQNLNMDIDEKFIASLSVEQLDQYYDQLISLSEARAVEDLACKPKKKAPKRPEPEEEEDDDEDEDEEEENLSMRFVSGKKQTGRAQTSAKVDLSADDAAVAIFGEYNPHKGRW